MSFPVLSFPYECAISTDLTVRYQPVRVCDINRLHCAICSGQGVRYAPIYAGMYLREGKQIILMR
jgi:hypothetical protein